MIWIHMYKLWYINFLLLYHLWVKKMAKGPHETKYEYKENGRLKYKK